jgi:hypothetical protein
MTRLVSELLNGLGAFSPWFGRRSSLMDYWEKREREREREKRKETADLSAAAQ